MDALEPRELLSILKLAKKENTRNWAMILTAYRHALRASEVCKLKLDDLDMKNLSIKCNRLKGSLEQTQALEPHRGIPELDEIKALKAWLREREKLDDGSGYLFLSKRGGSITRQRFYDLFWEYATREGVPENKRHPHVLKHSIVTHMVRENVNLAKIQIAAGHKAIKSTMQYAEVTGNEAGQARRQALMRIFG